MSKLFELSNNLIELELRIQDILVDESLSDKEREELSNDLLESYLENEGAFVDKLDNCLRYMNELERLSEVRKEEAKRLNNLAAQSKSRANNLRKYVLNHLMRTGKTSVETNNHRVFVKKGLPKIELDCESPEELPEEYKRVKVEADKLALKKALADPNSIAHKYAHLDDGGDSNYSLVIR